MISYSEASGDSHRPLVPTLTFGKIDLDNILLKIPEFTVLKLQVKQLRVETRAKDNHLRCHTGMHLYNIRLFHFSFNFAEWTNNHTTTVTFKYLFHSSLSLLSVHPPTTQFPFPPLVKVCLLMSQHKWWEWDIKQHGWWQWRVNKKVKKRAEWKLRKEKKERTWDFTATQTLKVGRAVCVVLLTYLFLSLLLFELAQGKSDGGNVTV